MSIPKFFIYGLLDPESYEIRYIGQSAQGLNRYNHSMNMSSLKVKSPKNDWIIELLKNNKIPLFKILEVCDFKDLNKQEIVWISNHKNLLNFASGGIGGNTRKSHLKWKPVISKNIENGILKEYSYVWEVEKDGFSPSKVSAVCLGKRKSHKRHIFIHKGSKFNDEIFSRPVFNTKKPIKRIDIKSLEIIIFDSISEAAKQSRVCVATISNCCRGKSKSRKYIFEYVNTPIDVEI